MHDKSDIIFLAMSLWKINGVGNSFNNGGKHWFLQMVKVMHNVLLQCVPVNMWRSSVDKTIYQANMLPHVQNWCNADMLLSCPNSALHQGLHLRGSQQWLFLYFACPTFELIVSHSMFLASKPVRFCFNFHLFFAWCCIDRTPGLKCLTPQNVNSG